MEHESGYANLETGPTTFAFATHKLGQSNPLGGYVAVNLSERQRGIEIAFISQNISGTHNGEADVGGDGVLAARGPWPLALGPGSVRHEWNSNFPAHEFIQQGRPSWGIITEGCLARAAARRLCLWRAPSARPVD